MAEVFFVYAKRRELAQGYRYPITDPKTGNSLLPPAGDTGMDYLNVMKN